MHWGKKGLRFIDSFSVLNIAVELFPLPACSGSFETARKPQISCFIFSFSSPYLAQFSYSYFTCILLHFPLFLHHSLFAVNLLQLLWSHTFISNRLSRIAFCFHSYWLSLTGCVRLPFHPRHLGTLKKKKINNLKSVLSIGTQLPAESCPLLLIPASLRGCIWPGWQAQLSSCHQWDLPTRLDFRLAETKAHNIIRNCSILPSYEVRM